MIRICVNLYASRLIGWLDHLSRDVELPVLLLLLLGLLDLLESLPIILKDLD